MGVISTNCFHRSTDKQIGFRSGKLKMFVASLRIRNTIFSFIFLYGPSKESGLVNYCSHVLIQ